MSCGSGNCGHTIAGRGVVLAAVVLATLAVGAGRAADIETRDFQVTVSGKPAGEVHMTIHRQDNGVIQMRCDTDIHVQILVKYKFIYRGHETWKDGRLLRLDSNTDDNGKRYIVTAVAEATGLRLRVNNVERMARPDVWLTSYWCLPDPKIRGEVIPIIDADNGKDLSGKLQFVGNEKRTVAGQTVALNHYRLAGASINMDLWYDGSERLVRQEWLEQGHRTILELTRVRR